MQPTLKEATKERNAINPDEVLELLIQAEQDLI